MHHPCTSMVYHLQQWSLFVIKKCALVYHLCLSTGVFVVKKKCFLCVAYGKYPNIFFEFPLKKQIFEVLKMCFRMDFLNTKIIFLHFWILHVCKTPKGIGQYFKKYKNLILGGIHLLFTVNVWIKKSLKDEYPKYYWE